MQNRDFRLKCCRHCNFCELTVGATSMTHAASALHERRELIGNRDLYFQIPSDVFRSAANLQRLKINSCGLFGTLPAEISQFSALTSIEIVGNSIVGTIPSEIGKLTKLRQLLLNDNKFFGTIPSAIVQLSFLQAIQLNQNQLSGDVPLIGSVGRLLQCVLQEEPDTNCLNCNGVSTKCFCRDCVKATAASVSSDSTTDTSTDTTDTFIDTFTETLTDTDTSNSSDSNTDNSVIPDANQTTGSMWWLVGVVAAACGILLMIGGVVVYYRRKHQAQSRTVA